MFYTLFYSILHVRESFLFFLMKDRTRVFVDGIIFRLIKAMQVPVMSS